MAKGELRISKAKFNDVAADEAAKLTAHLSTDGHSTLVVMLLTTLYAARLGNALFGKGDEDE